MLKVAGENVSTVEVEQVLAEPPGVAEVAVVGVPDEVRDEVPRGVRRPRGRRLARGRSAGALDAWCAERLGKAKRPRESRFVDELPRTSVGKIKKFLLMRPRPAGRAGRHSQRSLAAR